MDSRTGTHDIMDGSGRNEEPFHTLIRGTIWPGLIILNREEGRGRLYVITECYEEDLSDEDYPTFRWDCQPLEWKICDQIAGQLDLGSYDYGL